MEKQVQKAKEDFLEYASHYDAENGMIRLKILHTMEVLNVMEQLTESLKLDRKTRRLAAITAIYHDVGRFEQVRRYHTFLDHMSEDHAELGCKVIREEKMLADLSETERTMVIRAIRNHNRYAIEEGLDEQTLLLAKLIRDADKSDIFRVFAFEDLVDTMGETLQMVEQETITEAVYQSFMRHECIDKRIRKTGLDKWVGFLAFFFDMYFEESIRLQAEKGYYRKQFDQAHFADPDTDRRVKEILLELETYLKEKLPESVKA